MRIIAYTLCSAAALAVAAPAFADPPLTNPPGRVVTFSGQNGGGFVAETDRDVDRASRTGALDRDVTFNDGSTRSVNAQATRTGQGTADVTRTVTRRNGESVTQTGSVAATRTDDGRITTGLWETPAGSVSTNTRLTRGEGVRQRDATAVFEDGSSRRSSTTATRTGPGAADVSQTVTGRNDGVRQRQGSVTVNRRP